MPAKKRISSFGTVLTVILLLATISVSAQTDPTKRYRVIDGRLQEITVLPPVDSTGIDSLTVGGPLEVTDSVTIVSDAPGTIIDQGEPEGERTRRARRAVEGDQARYSRLFRDTIPISTMTAISVVVPGFGQVYNKQAWKVPILYGVAGGLAYAGFKEHGKYKDYKRGADYLSMYGAPQSEIDRLQEPMIKHNTAKTLLWIGAAATYIYALGDGVINYDGVNTSVKIATTLSTVCPGAGQFYNKSYWKVPIVVGGFATMIYIIDWNNRGYQRTKTAYDIQMLIESGDAPEGLQHEFSGRNITSSQLKSWKNSYRRNRDLSLILTAGFYVLNIVDAHVDAHLKDFDVSDNLALNVYPSIDRVYMASGSSNSYGITLGLRF